MAGDTKTYAGTRKIILPPSTAQLLRDRKRKSFSPWIFHDPLRLEAPIDPDSTYRQLKKFLAEAVLPNIRFHDLRHLFSAHAPASGVDAKTLARILGHTKAEENQADSKKKDLPGTLQIFSNIDYINQ